MDLFGGGIIFIGTETTNMYCKGKGPGDVSLSLGPCVEPSYLLPKRE